MLQQIKDVFDDCKHLETSNCTNCDVKSSYVTILNEKFFVFDSKEDEPVKIVAEEQDHQLRVINNTGEAITLIKTDDCLFNDDTKKCDCIVLNEKQCFLVEIKTSSKGTRGTARQDAKKQLGITIDLLRNNNVNLSSMNVEARICFKGGKSRPTQASYNTMRASFSQEYGVMLDEGHTITFNPAVPVPEDGTGNAPDAKVE